MKALRIKKHGGLDCLVFEELPVPQPGPGEVRVQVAASAINHLDLWVRRGVEGHAFPLPLTPGCDAAGQVHALGPGVRGWSEGDEVVIAPGLSCGTCSPCLAGSDQLCRAYGILGETRDGAHAPFMVVPARNLMRKPKNLPFTAAGAFGLTFLTAWHMLVSRAALRPAETVLIHAAGSGVSSAGIQIARFMGARIIATAGSEAKLARARDLGASHTINYRSTYFTSQVRALTGRRGVDVVFDHVGADTFAASVKVLARGGRYVFCGATSGFDLRTDFRPVFFKSLSILGSTMGSQGELRRIRELVEDGHFKPVVERILPLARAAEGHAALEKREVFGKVVLSISGEAASGDPAP
ncbi:MAG: zinc-binding dehydrogenase [Acidobacteriota bacterium]